MGDAQSAQRQDKKDAAAEEESGTVDDAQTEDKPFKNNGQISEINEKADSSTAEVNGHCEDEIAAEAILSPGEDVSETVKPHEEEEIPLENVELTENESPNEVDANEDVPLEMTEMDAKQNDINDGFRRFFSNIGLKLTVKRGSGEEGKDIPDETNKEEANRSEDVENTAKETTSENTEPNTDVNTAQETYDNDSTTCPTLTDATSGDILENAEEKIEETEEEVESNNADAVTSPVNEHQDATEETEEKPHSMSSSHLEEEVVVSPIKRFFTTGIFSGLRKKKKSTDNGTTEKELVDMGKKEAMETTEQTLQDQQQDKEEVSPSVEAALVETEHKENEVKEEILSAASAETMDETKSSTTDPSAIIVTEPEMISSQDKDKVQASPLKRLLSGSSLKKLSKKQRGRRSSDAKLSDSGEHVSDQLLSSTESAENQRESPAQASAEAAGEEDSAWASFKKLVTPKKRMKRSSLGNEETQIPCAAEEPKPSDGEQILDHSTEEGKKRKDSSVSWEAVLCGSGRRRSRKTSDSEDETPQIDNNDDKQDGGSKHAAESHLESSNEVDEILASSPKQAGSPSEGDGGSTWKSLKKLVTPKKKARDEDESKDNIQSDSEIAQDESSFSIKKLLPGRKKRRSAEKQEQVSSDEADKDVASGDEDSETPAVVPLSEFDTVETEVHIETKADVESHIPMEADSEHQQDLLDQIADTVPPCDNLQTETKKVQDIDESLQNQASTTPATYEEPADLSESISKHQQLSDIPEEGIITETMGTPASANEETARDDTIADDLIEITSDAVTAPEPIDITLADETEMVSAVSQLTSESSKTSGNTTPVPAEYDVKETDSVLHQVVQTISVSPEEAPLCSEELNYERIVGSVTPQILESFVKEEPTILEIHTGLDATVTDTDLNVEELDAINKLSATVQYSTSEVNDSVSTEIVSGGPTKEFDTAEIVVDEVHEINVSHPEESVKELEAIDESHQLVECLSELVAPVSTDILPEGEKIVPDEGPLVEAHQAETEAPNTDSQEANSAAALADKSKDGTRELEVKTLTEKEDHMMYNIPNLTKPVEEGELEEPAAVQAATLDSEGESVQSLVKEVISEDRPADETDTNELKKETVPSTKVNDKPDREDEVEALEIPEALETEQASTFDSEEGGVQSPEEGIKSEDVPPVETVTDETNRTAEHLTEVTIDTDNKELPVNAGKTEHVQEPVALETVQASTLDSEEVSVKSLEKEVISEDVPEAETVSDEPKTEETEMTVEPEEKLHGEAAKTDHIQEVEVLPSDIKEIETKTEEAATMHVVTESVEEGSAQEHEKQILLEDIPKPDADNVIASVTNVIESEVVAQLEQALETTEDQETKIIPQGVQVEQEDHIPEVIDELQTLTAVHVSSLNEEVSNVQVIEKTVFIEGTSAPCEETAAVTNEPKHEEHLSAVQVSVEGEKETELPGMEIKTAAVEHVGVAQMVTSDYIDVSVATPDVLIEKTSETTEPLIDTVANELMSKDEVEAAAPFVKDDVVVTAEEGSVVVTVSNEDSQIIQVQVVDVDIKSAETIVDTMLQVGVTEAKEVIGVCQETVKEVDNFYATPKIEEELIKEENVTIQEVIQHVKENLPETVLQSVVISLEQEVVKPPDAAAEVSEMVASESSEMEEQKTIQVREREDETPAVISEDSATEQQVSEDLIQAPGIPGSLDVSVRDRKEDLEETKAEQEKSEVGVIEEEVKSPSEELGGKKIHEQAQITQIAQSPIVPPGNTGLVVPQNTGIVSSIGNVESPSSLSLEFKLNIQFGQVKAPASPPPTTERVEPIKHADVSEVGVQAVDPVMLINPTQKVDCLKQAELTQITEPAPNLDSTEKVGIVTEPVLLDVGIQAVETVEPVEEIKSTERVTSIVQATETIQPVRQTEKREMFLSHPVPSEACDQETKAEEPIKQTEEENDQDVWMDAEEVIDTQGETGGSPVEVEEPPEPQTESEQEKAGLEREVEITPDSKSEEEEGQQEMSKTEDTREFESEGEDFVVALENPEIATTNISNMEWD
ncbi:A-kinase anchor protein 12 [Pempheris klunzingeri]|uniref:A-kinase anchor protein 12 n=1 Tax=Pempheris klunzingeri TaxID=3127111 RepID=UPI003981108E